MDNAEPHTPDYPPDYLGIIIDRDGYVNEHMYQDHAEAMRYWERIKGEGHLHAFLYVVPTSGSGNRDRKYLLHSF